jgi:competence ComEA-like helix-hairpin-helix protein
MMLNFTPEERKVILFFLSLAFCGLALSNLVKANARLEKIVYPQAQLAKINLNKANLGELIGLRCISVKLVQRILEYRDLHHEFTSLEELKEVKGVGLKRYEKLKDIFFIE